MSTTETPRSQVAYDLITAYVAEHPGASIKEAADACADQYGSVSGISQAYYQHKRILANRVPKRRKRTDADTTRPRRQDGTYLPHEDEVNGDSPPPKRNQTGSIAGGFIPQSASPTFSVGLQDLTEDIQTYLTQISLREQAVEEREAALAEKAAAVEARSMSISKLVENVRELGLA